MNAKLRLPSCVAGILALFLPLATNVGPGFSLATRETNAGPTDVVRELQVASASDLDRALRAGDLQKARLLVPESWAAAEQLFVSYLDRAFIRPDIIRSEPDARTLAGRLADVFFRIVEYDFARAVVLTLDTADAAKRQQLASAVRDYFVTLERLRATTSVPFNPQRAGSELFVAPRERLTTQRRLVATQFLEIADRFRALSCPRGELWTLRSMINLTGTGLPSMTERADKLADQLGDELSLVRRPWTEAVVAAAERLGLRHRQVTALYELGLTAARSTALADLERAAQYLERARELSRRIPSLETVNYWLFPSAAPLPARSILPELWSVYQKLKRPAEAQPLVAEAVEISRPFGERAVAFTLSQFASRATRLGGDAGEAVLQASEAASRAAEEAALRTSQAHGPKAELETLRGLSGVGPSFRRDLAEKAVALAAAMPDSHERAVTAEWFGRNYLLWLNSARSKAAVRPEDQAVPAIYRKLLDLCLASDELDLTADALATQGELQARHGDPALSTEAYKQALDLAERSGDWLRVAQIANRAILPPTGRPSNAARVEFARRAVEAARKADSALELAKALRESAGTLEEIEQAVAAAARYTEQSGDPGEELASLDHLANHHFSLGQYQAAIDTYLRIAARSPDQAGPGNRRKLNAYQRVLTMYSTIGEPSLARETADRVRQLLETTVFEAERPAPALEIGVAYNELGDMAAELGEPVAAMEYWDKALKKLAEAAPSNSAQLTRRTILEARATLYAKLGDFEAALNDWNAVLPLIAPTWQNYYGFSETGHMVAWRTAVAWTHALAGNLEKALTLARDAIAELQGDTSGLWAGLWYDKQSAEERLVEILLVTNHPEAAIPLIEGLRRPVIGPPREKLLLRLLARAYAAIKQPDKARSLLTAAIEIDRSRPTGTFIGGLSGSLLALGALELEGGNIPEAKQRLLEARDAVNPYDLEQIWQIERTLARALVRTGDGAGAEAHYENALNALESVRERLRPEESRLRYGFDRSRVYEEYAGFLSARAVVSGGQADAEDAFQAVERKRTQIVASLLAMGWSRMPREAVPDQVRRLRDTEARLAAKQGILREQFDRPFEKRDNVLIEKVRSDLSQARGEHARLLSAIAQTQYRYAAPTALASGLAAPVQAALGPSRVLVEYLVGDDRSYAFVVSRAGVKVVPLTVGRGALRQQVQHLLAPFRQLRAGTVDLARLDYDLRAAHTLYQAIFAPVQPFLGSASDIVIVPDDVLNFLPFDALVEKVPQGTARGQVRHAELAGQAFLLRRYAITYLSSSAQLLSSPAAAGPVQATKRFFAMANATAGRVTPEPAQDDPLKRQLRSGALDMFLAPLPGAEAEVRRITRFFARDAATVVTGAAATETAYESQAGQFGIVHFATHAVASDNQPLYSTLILAPDAAAKHDGFLQAYEVLRTPLRAELVVLSGCETALGSEDWGQGLVGLVAAFEQAGARSVLATLWSIDESTADVMAAFYRAMTQGRSTSAALRQAKLQLLQRRVLMGNVEISLAHPFFWAPFKLMGVPSK